MKKGYSFSAVALSLVLSMLVVDPVWATTSTDLQEKQNKLEQEEQALKNQKKDLEKGVLYGIMIYRKLRDRQRKQSMRHRIRSWI